MLPDEVNRYNAKKGRGFAKAKYIRVKIKTRNMDAKDYLKKNTNIQLDIARAMLYNVEGKDLLRWMEEYANSKLLDFAKVYFEILDTQSVPPPDSVIVNEYLKTQKND